MTFFDRLRGSDIIKLKVVKINLKNHENLKLCLRFKYHKKIATVYYLRWTVFFVFFDRPSDLGLQLFVHITKYWLFSKKPLVVD